MIQEIAVADMQPSVKTCFPLLESLQSICLLHGNDISYYRLVFQTVENIITKTTKDDISGYLLFLEDVSHIWKIPRRKWYAKNPA